MAKDLPITEFDMLTLNESTQLFKAMIPFLDYNLQKTLSLMIRINELQQTMNFYNNPCNRNSFSSCSCTPPLSACSSLSDLLNNEQLIQIILKYCPENYASMLQNFLQFYKMADLFNFSQMQNGDFSSMLQNAAGMFSASNAYSDVSSSGNATADTTAQNNTSQNTTPQNSTSQNATGHTAGSQRSPDTHNQLKSFMNAEQQKMYDQFMHELDNVDFPGSNS